VILLKNKLTIKRTSAKRILRAGDTKDRRTYHSHTSWGGTSNDTVLRSTFV